MKPSGANGRSPEKLVRNGVSGLLLTALLLWGAAGDYRPSAFDLAVAPYRYDLARWEVSNFLDKWTRKLGDVLPWNSEPSREQRVAQAQEYFALGEEIAGLERQFVAKSVSDAETLKLQAKIDVLSERRKSIQGEIEETLESAISSVLAEEGFASRIGVIFPPVDTVYARSPGVLILSPRDRISRVSTDLLRPGIDDQERETLEKLVLQELNLAALVENTGGVAAYPSVVSSSGSLHGALVTTAHEWLHHWFFFQPLGQHFWDSADMTTLNETAATLGGRAIGDRALTAMTGEVIDRDALPAEVDPDAFDFNAEMRETRLRAEELLAEGKIEEAEAYMEERRQLLIENRFFIRKINQAFFAFHGSYATSAASVSPVDEQLRTLQNRTESLADFLKTVARFGSYEGFLGHIEG